jgi:hypothetical protein
LQHVAFQEKDLKRKEMFNLKMAPKKSERPQLFFESDLQVEPLVVAGLSRWFYVLHRGGPGLIFSGSSWTRALYFGLGLFWA